MEFCREAHIALYGAFSCATCKKYVEFSTAVEI